MFYVALQISIGTINMEPYITENDFWRLGFEIIFMVWVFYDICSLLIIVFKIATDTDGYDIRIRTGPGSERRSVLFDEEAERREPSPSPPSAA